MVDTAITLRFVSDIAIVMLIWLVQLVIYPAYHVVEAHRFVRWHEGYTRTISVIVIPLMFVQAGSILFLLAKNPGVIHMLETALLMLAWSATFTLSVPCHKKLHEQGKDTDTINRLVQTNWLRTFAWTVVMLLGWIPG